MSPSPVAIAKTGLVTPVGLDAAAACAAMRCKLTNPVQTFYMNSEGEWMRAHQVPLPSVGGTAKLVHMAAMAVEEVLLDIPKVEWSNIPLLLCVSEADRPGRAAVVDEHLVGRLEQALAARFGRTSAVVAEGRVSAAVAMSLARAMIERHHADSVVIASTDSLVSWPTLLKYDDEGRILSETNSDGFVPGEGAAALLVTRPTGAPQLLCRGIGFGQEAATIHSDLPLRADGLTSAIRSALEESGLAMHDLDFRIADVSGEQYYFKEASLALSRTLRRRKPDFDIWHPAECIGEAGATAGLAMLALADAGCRKGFVPGRSILAHMSNDNGRRAAIIVQFRDGA